MDSHLPNEPVSRRTTRSMLNSALLRNNASSLPEDYRLNTVLILAQEIIDKHMQRVNEMLHAQKIVLDQCVNIHIPCKLLINHGLKAKLCVTLFYIACRLSTLDVVKQLTELGASANGIITYADAPNPDTAIHASIESGIDVLGKVKHIVDCYTGFGVLGKVNHTHLINAFNSFGETALHMGASYGYIDVCKYLISQGANIAVLAEGCTQAKYSFLMRGKPKRKGRIIAEKADTPIHVATGYTNIIRLFLGHGVYVNIRGHSKRTPLHYAAMHGHINAISLFIERGADVYSKDAFGDTPLHAVSQNGHFECVYMLIYRYNIDINAQNNNRQTALHRAVWEGHVEIVKLLAAHPRCDLMLTDYNGRTAMDLAREFDRHAVVKVFDDLEIGI